MGLRLDAGRRRVATMASGGGQRLAADDGVAGSGRRLCAKERHHDWSVASTAVSRGPAAVVAVAFVAATANERAKRPQPPEKPADWRAERRGLEAPSSPLVAVGRQTRRIDRSRAVVRHLSMVSSNK